MFSEHSLHCSKVTLSLIYCIYYISLFTFHLGQCFSMFCAQESLGILSKCRLHSVDLGWSLSLCVTNKPPGMLMLLVPDHIWNESWEGSDLFSVHLVICGMKLESAETNKCLMKWGNEWVNEWMKASHTAVSVRKFSGGADVWIGSLGRGRRYPCKEDHGGLRYSRLGSGPGHRERHECQIVWEWKTWSSKSWEGPGH